MEYWNNGQKRIRVNAGLKTYLTLLKDGRLFSLSGDCLRLLIDRPTKIAYLDMIILPGMVDWYPQPSA